MRTQARVVIVGGGVMGIDLQYHLALEGWTDTVLVEKAELTSGSTWHAAGQCPSFIANYTMAKVHAHSNRLYARLEAMTGMPTGWHASGGIRFATTREELDHFRRVEGVAANIGFRMQVIGLDEIRRINPFVTTTGVLAGAWTLDDGYVDPSSACNAMAFAARELGATIVRFSRVLGIERLPGGEFRVSTEQGAVFAEQRMDIAMAQLKIDMIVRQYAREALDDTAHFYHKGIGCLRFHRIHSASCWLGRSKPLLLPPACQQ